MLRRKVKEIFKGSFKGPFCCLRVISVILFLVLISGSGILFKSLANQGDFSFLNNLPKVLAEKSSLSSFIDPSKKLQTESPDFLLVQKNSLVEISPPTIVTPQILGALTGESEPEDVQKIIVEYIVESGDSLWSLAEKFNISLNTILWANDLNKSSTIKPGQKLVIPPVSGVIHYVKSGDTTSEIAQKYKAKVEEILAFNELSSEGDIYIGDILIIPNGVIPTPSVKYVSAPTQVPLASNYFISPLLPPYKITQGLHWYNAVDLTRGNCGEPIYAAAGGKVLKVKLTSSRLRSALGGLGSHLTILHPNGVITLYAHLFTSLVSPGDDVSQGQIIALVGGEPGTPGAGRSTGCHLHFGVQGAKNPLAR